METKAILKNWQTLIDSVSPHSFDAIETQYTKWKQELLKVISPIYQMTMLESAALNNNMRVFSFIYNEIGPDNQRALEYALYNGNYNIARALLIRKNRIPAPLKSPVYREDAVYHRLKINTLLAEFNDTTRVQEDPLVLPESEPLNDPPTEYDVSIDDAGPHPYFLGILTNRPVPYEEITILGESRFYYKKYSYTGVVLQLEYVYTTLLIEALEMENMAMIDYLIDGGIVHCADIEYLNREIGNSCLYDTRILLYKEVYQRLITKK